MWNHRYLHLWTCDRHLRWLVLDRPIPYRANIDFIAWTAFDALDLGYRTILVEDACQEISAEDVKVTFAKIKEESGLVVNSSEVISMIIILFMT